MSQPTYPSPSSKEGIVLDALLAANGQPVGLNILMRIARCGCVHSKVSTLRIKCHWHIINEIRWVTNESGERICHSEYHIPLYWLQAIQREAV